MTRTLKLLPAAALALILGASAVCAQLRSIPAEAKRGLIRHLQEMTVEINGRPMLLAAGAQIRDATNLIVLPAAVPARSLVKYTLDAQGRLGRVWILTAEEAAQPEPRR
jgi:hypothetical protein